MSSISSSDRARYDEQIRKIREEYENKEAENAKRKAAEVQRLEQRHSDELSSIKENYDSKITDLSQRNRDSLSQRDFEHNKKINEVRQTYQEALRLKSEDAYNSRQAQKQSYEGALQKQKQVSEYQQSSLRNKMQDEIAVRDERYQNLAADTQAKSKQSVQDIARKLNDAHTKERQTLVDGFVESQSERERQFSETKKDYNARLKDSERKREFDNARWSQKYEDSVANKTGEYNDHLEIKQQLLDSERRDMRSKYQSALDSKIQAVDSEKEQFKDTVNERLNSQVRSRDSKISRLNSQLNNEISKNEKLRQAEMKNLASVYEDRMAEMEAQRDGGMAQIKKTSDERMGRIQEKNDDLLRARDRENRSQVSSMKNLHREEREILAQQHKDQVTQISNNAEGRVQKILDLSNKQAGHLGRYYADSLDVVKTNYENRMDSYREKTSGDRVANSRAMTERFRNLEVSFNEKMNQTVKSYESKMEQMMQNHEKEMGRLQNLHAERNSEKDKSIHLERETLAMKYEAKLARMSDAHQQQVDRMNRRHEVDMQNLSSKVSYSRKA